MSSTSDQSTTLRPPQSETPPLTDRRPGTVTVRYWAAARAAAGRAQDEVPAGTLTEVLAAVRALHGDRPRLSQVLSVCSVLVGEEPVGSRDRDQVAVPPGTSVEILPPFAGGSEASRHDDRAAPAASSVRDAGGVVADGP